MRQVRLLMAVLMVVILVCPWIAGAEEEDKEPEYEMVIDNWKIASVLTGGIHISEYRDWYSGGADTVAINGRFDFWAVRETEKHMWRNRIRLEYGVTRVEGEDYRSSADVLQLDTRFEYKFNPSIFAYVRGYAATHIGDQYDYFDDPVDIIFFDQPVEEQVKRTRVSKSFDPLNLEQGIGVGWVAYSSEEDQTSVIAMVGAGSRQMLSDSYFVEDDNPITPQLEYQPVDEYNDVGAEGVLDVIWTISDVAQFTSHGAGFYGFDNERWSARWENALDLKVTSYVGVKLSAEMLYDEAVVDSDQWKLGTMVTLSYRVF